MKISPTIRLSTQQENAVEHLYGPLVVIAGPGSGKTRVLTERIRLLLTNSHEHFRVLALTFTNKAADDMRERLEGLGEARQRAFIGTIHAFCLEMLTERGKFVGVEGTPNIFEQTKDRREILLKAVQDDPYLSDIINQIAEPKDRSNMIDKWLKRISFIKIHPMSYALIADQDEQRLINAYDAGMRACNAYDFDDLLLLTYQLLTENPKLADFYRRLYKFVCVDEAQDMNEAQYAVLLALCGNEQKNIMLVGDPKQSIYGFNQADPKYMESFKRDFNARVMILSENFRSSKAVVNAARTLDDSYLVESQLPIKGELGLLKGRNEIDEANIVLDKLQELIEEGHEDIEGEITPSRFAILGRTRFTLLSIEKELLNRNIPYYKSLSSTYENESSIATDFHLALRVLANPKNNLHFSALGQKWRTNFPLNSEDVLGTLREMAAITEVESAVTVVEALQAIRMSPRLDLMPALAKIKFYADILDDERRLPIYEDMTVLEQEWDQYLRAGAGNPTLPGFLSNRALGTTQSSNKEGVALLTVHASKGLEFDVVFIVGMAEGVFPDYRATTGKALEEERRSAFVAITRSKRLLYFSFPSLRRMPWGDDRNQRPSQFLPPELELLSG